MADTGGSYALGLLKRVGVVFLFMANIKWRFL
jgi:hypothetical protein